MKPLEARTRLAECAQILAAGQPLPPMLRAWMVRALLRRIHDPAADLDRLLELRSRAGGRLHAFSPLPARDRALQAIAGEAGADALHARLTAYRAGAADPELSRIEREHGRLPSSRRQLHRILRGQTAASQVNRR